MKTVSLAEALSVVLGAREKHAQITTDPKAFFVHVRVPDHVASRLGEIQKRVLPDAATHQEIDHVTLVYTQKPEGDHPPEKVHAALDSLRALGERTAPIDAKIQGWGYFDGAAKDGQPRTALVALLDAPGLEHLHVDASRALSDHGIHASKTHIFTPHITLGYLPQHGRADTRLEPIDGTFTIDSVHVASRDNHEVPLTGAPMSLGQKAAAFTLSSLPMGAQQALVGAAGGAGAGVIDYVTDSPEERAANPLSRRMLIDGGLGAAGGYAYGKFRRGLRENAYRANPQRAEALFGPQAKTAFAIPPAARAALIGGGIGAGAGLLGSAVDYANDSDLERAQSPLWKRMLVNGGIGAVGGGIVGATHRLSRPSAQATSDLVDSLDQQRFASLGEEAAARVLGGR